MLQSVENAVLSVNKRVDKKEALDESTKLVPVMVSVPRGALDLLAFRYHQFAGVEILNDKMLIETAVKELTKHQLGLEYQSWQMRTLPEEKA